MPLTVTNNPGTRPVPRRVTRAVVIQHARTSGHPQANRALAITLPTLTIDQTRLQYETRAAGRQFRFRTGALRLSLTQAIYIANNLSSNAENVWAAHEQDHVRDNRQIMPRMDRRIRASAALRTILITPIWRPRSSFNNVQRTIQSTVDDIFKKLTRDAVRARDTDAEYARIRRAVGRTYALINRRPHQWHPLP
jgi:hypothetical protein